MEVEKTVSEKFNECFIICETHRGRGEFQFAGANEKTPGCVLKMMCQQDRIHT
jgi:hypothetical protein